MLIEMNFSHSYPVGSIGEAIAMAMSRMPVAAEKMRIELSHQFPSDREAAPALLMSIAIQLMTITISEAHQTSAMATLAALSRVSWMMNDAMSMTEP